MINIAKLFALDIMVNKSVKLKSITIHWSFLTINKILGNEL